MGAGVKKWGVFGALATLLVAGTGTAWAVEARDGATEAGVSETAVTFSANVGDFNDDGLDDFLLVRHNADTSRLYRNDGGHFTEVAAGTFFKKDRHDCAWEDVDLDGLLDVFCTRGAGGGKIVKANELWIQGPAETFENRAVDYGVVDPYGRGRWTTFVDVNHDPYPDLYVGNDYPRQDDRPSPNRLYINEGGTHFRTAPEYGLDVEAGSRSVQAADYDGDGWEDLLVCGKRRLIIYRNEAGASFTDVTQAAGVSGGCAEAAWEDMNGDGSLDLARVTSRLLSVQLQSEGKFNPAAYKRSLVAGWSLATGDADGDSWSDLYVVQTKRDRVKNHPDLMLLNDGTGTGYVSETIPQTTQGVGQAVAPIDHDDNGLTDFIVLNGRDLTPGPVQLVSFHNVPVDS